MHRFRKLQSTSKVLHAVVPFFKITEEFSLGQPTSMSRRDLKPGKQQATASIGGQGELVIDISWGTPNPGESLSLPVDRSHAGWH